MFMKILRRRNRVMISLEYEDYRKWISQNVSLSNAYSTESMKDMACNILLGRNYRLTTEKNTKTRLFYTYAWLIDVVNEAKDKFKESWKINLFKELLEEKKKEKETKNLMYWLIGLTLKTAENLNVKSNEELLESINSLHLHMQSEFRKIGREQSIDEAWLLMMAGSATLNIRGSEKSKIGKKLEKIIIKSMLTILGLEFEKDFWMNINRDLEVSRESDAEIKTKRGRIRVEIGLISSGNQEVIEDKINRVGRNGVIIFDKVGSKTKIYETANKHGVTLIQIRNNQPLSDLYQTIKGLTEKELLPPPQTKEKIFNAVNGLLLKDFEI